MMKNFYLPLALAVGGNLVYHISQKAVPKGANPLYTMMLVYLIGVVVCAAGALILPGEKSLAETLRESNWTIPVMALAVVAIEVGFLLAYRVGWNLSTAAVTVSVAATLLLVPLGLFAYREHLTARNVVGLILCLLGLLLVSKK